MVFADKPRVRFALGIVLVVLMTAPAIFSGRDYWRLATDGVTVPARVIKLERQKSRRGFFYRYYATYRFRDDAGGRHAGRQQISEDLYTVLQASKPDRDIVATYCRSNPRVSAISVGSVRNDFLIFSAIALVAWGGFYLVCLQQRRENAGIVAALRRRIQIDNARRGPAVAGRPDADGGRSRMA